jgi:hypothetical protein
MTYYMPLLLRSISLFIFQSLAPAGIETRAAAGGAPSVLPTIVHPAGTDPIN